MIRALIALAVLAVVAPSIGFANEPPPGHARPKTYMLLVAHPDDENMIGGVLARLAREGHDVRVVIATDGKYSPLATDIPAGDALGAARRLESQCAARELGIAPPVFLGIDRLDTKNGVRQYLDARPVFLAALTDQLKSIDPDVIITFGPDGEYGHPEHIVAAAGISEILLRDGLVARYPLYYMGWLREQVADDDSLSHVDPRYMGVMARYTDDDERKQIAAGRCYVTQFTPEEMDAMATGVKGAENVVYFRRFRVDEIPPGQAADLPW